LQDGRLASLRSTATDPDLACSIPHCSRVSVGLASQIKRPSALTSATDVIVALDLRAGGNGLEVRRSDVRNVVIELSAVAPWGPSDPRARMCMDPVRTDGHAVRVGVVAVAGVPELGRSRDGLAAARGVDRRRQARVVAAVVPSCKSNLQSARFRWGVSDGC
jgi:hypothetical protein